MAATATTREPKPVPIDMDAHQADLASRRAAREGRREELLKCCNPHYAASRELEKPVYQWRVKANWFGIDGGLITNFDADETVVGRNEADAWSHFCDKLGTYPSRREAKPEFTKGKKLTAEAVAAMDASGSTDAEAGTIPKKTLGAKPKKRVTL